MVYVASSGDRVWSVNVALSDQTYLTVGVILRAKGSTAAKLLLSLFLAANWTIFCCCGTAANFTELSLDK